MSIGQILTSFLLLALSYFMRAARLYSYFPAEMSGKFSSCLRIVFHHTFFNNILPMKTGEAAFPLLMRRHFSIPLSRATGALFSFRLADMTILSLLSLLMVILSVRFFELASSALSFFLIFISTLSVMLILIYKLRQAIPWVEKYWNQFKTGLPSSYAMAWKLLLWTMLAWSTKLVAYALILVAFVNVPFQVSLLSAIGGELASSIPIHTPASFGTFESGISVVLIPAGFDIKSALMAAVNLHLFILASSVLLAGLGLLIRRPSDDTR
jgi:uncharacterized membrane protein YbhN (UPF0104 family)